ncbi:hypothetical protein P8C59_004961 [Phyllachora maydis]|uniref:Uncharacterized protein n=1 Tax=Phyllachora maydis TaxID=1825666 RepID=A0AAD9MF13_9PEZI|nr:hypothetical protein P8C59_004961 [Phyllachora maydis]
MESIQLAQMLADLSDLHAAQESQTAVALVSANKTIAPPTEPQQQQQQQPHLHDGGPTNRHHQRVQSARFDKMGRRILTPPLTRTNSAQGSGSSPGTPRSHEGEDDVDRANSLMALYEIRAKLKQQDNTSLMKVREKIAALQRQQAEKRDGSAERPLSRYTYPKSSS